MTDREVLEDELFKHRPITSMKDGSIAGCTCMDRVFVNGVEDWDSHVADALLTSGVLGVPADPTEIDGLHEQYPEVARFVTRMLRELWANRGKGDQAGWRAMSLRQAWSEIAWHVGKMTTAIKSEDWALVRELAADIANGAMMLDDIVSRSTEEADRG